MESRADDCPLSSLPFVPYTHMHTRTHTHMLTHESSRTGSPFLTLTKKSPLCSQEYQSAQPLSALKETPNKHITKKDRNILQFTA